MSVWIALLEVEIFDTEGEVQEAYVNALVEAESVEIAKAAYEQALQELNGRLVGVEEIEDFDKRCSAYRVRKKLKTLARVAAQTGTAQFDTFHVWKEP